ncbi:MAG: hypothetical protein HC892_20705 [Saprospiraceae bacterium]|nr:hypothetical protein [Saprospiraceae bacterium]
MATKTIITDEFEFGDVMFNGTTPILKNGVRSACVRNLDMIEPTTIETRKIK